jgi:hypothetical protein
VISFIGGMTGLAAAVGIGRIVQWYSPLKPLLEPGVVMLSLGICVAVGLWDCAGFACGPTESYRVAAPRINIADYVIRTRGQNASGPLTKRRAERVAFAIH